MTKPGLRGVLAIGESAVLDGADEERCPLTQIPRNLGMVRRVSGLLWQVSNGCDPSLIDDIDDMGLHMVTLYS